MIRLSRTLFLLGLMGTFVGCGEEGAKPTAEQKAPDYGKKSADELKAEIGVPSAKGMVKPAAAK